MPSRNIVKVYQENSFYHIYNRGVDKRPVFHDDRDYRIFLSYFKLYLTPPSMNYSLPSSNTRINNYSHNIQLLAYCLMPNHVHLLVRQVTKDAIKSFMQSLFIKYVRYFNRRYQRKGRLFETIYKAVLLQTEPQLLELSRYIHNNPQEITRPKSVLSYPYSSYQHYLSDTHPIWLYPQDILAYFSKTIPHQNYQSYIENSLPNSPSIQSLTLD